VTEGVTVKSRLNLKINQDLKDWARGYAKKRGTDVTKLITEYFIFLREQELQEELRNTDYIEQI
jgi:hypothetical protein